MLEHFVAGTSAPTTADLVGINKKSSLSTPWPPSGASPRQSIKAIQESGRAVLHCDLYHDAQAGIRLLLIHAHSPLIP
ncbi:hypothetical protein [Vitreimonas sp.]|uniref:hypothetical protein n=1 Tax=Vitreimonas sp. TaxID=3069702 RepID=UPI002D77BE9F|nr:hypothetical protein [Vitreimonas sp.]